MSESPSEANAREQSPSEANEYEANVWGQSDEGVGELHPLTVPSGQKCLVLRPGVPGLLEAGILHNVDGLTAMVEKHIQRKRNRPQDHKRKGQKDSDVDVDVESLMKDEKSLRDIMTVVNKAVVAFVVKPAVKHPPEKSSDRKKGVIYTDMVDINDRMFIFNYLVGGSADLDSFRDGLQETMGSVEALQDVQMQAE